MEIWPEKPWHKHLYLSCAWARMLLNFLYILDAMCQETSLRILLVRLQIILI